MSNKIGVVITDGGGTFQQGTCFPDDFYLTSTADVRVNWGGSPRSDYGAFYDTTDQPLVNVALAQVITINSTTLSNNVSIVAGSKMTFANAGTFNIQFSLQFTNDDTQPRDAVVWFRKNGTDISYSASQITIAGKHGGIKGHYILSLNLIENFNANDYVELWWHGDDVDLSIETLPAGVVPVYPVVPSVIITATKVL
jgi:hypothetical protein